MNFSLQAAEAIRTAKHSVVLVGTPDVAFAETLVAAVRAGRKVWVVSDDPKVLAPDSGAEWLCAAVPGESEFIAADGHLSPADRDVLQRLEEATRFNFGQYEAEHAPLAADVMLRASAGTGKTEALAARVLFLLHHGVPADRICMLTFTREAAANMRERIVRTLSERLRRSGNPLYLRWMCEVSHLHVSTIHSFAKTIVARFGPAAGVPAGVRIAARNYERSKLIEQTISDLLPSGQTTNSTVGLRLYELVAVVGRCLDTLSNRGVDVTETPLDWGTSPIDSGLPLGTAVATTASRLAELKARDGIVELGDLTVLARKAIRRLAAPNRPLVRFDHILVDEFQDTDDGQIELLATLAGTGPRLFVVGDVKQSIYRFRGAEHTAFARLRTQLSGRRIVELSLRKNYRSSGDLLTALRPIWQSLSGRDLLDYIEPRDAALATKKIDGAAVTRRTYVTAGHRDGVIRTLIPELLADAKGRPLAALVRTNVQAHEFRNLCASIGVTCLIDTEGGLFDSAAARDLLVLARVLTRTTDPRSLLDLASSRWANRPCSTADLWQHRGRAELPRFLLETIEQAIPEWHRICDLPRTLPVLQVIREAIDICRPEVRAVGTGNGPTEYLLCLDRILELCSEKFATDSLTLPALEAWLASSIASQPDEPIPVADELQEAPLRCVTVHKAKGLQYDTVLIPYVSKRFTHGGHEILLSEPVGTVGWRLRTPARSITNSHHRSLRREEQTETRQDEARLLYVAATRAERRLAVVMPTTVAGDTWADLLVTA
jgi:ATP-dependent exoDNAse (exonuclease V) beta subunit